MCNCLCSCVVECGMMMKGREKVKPGDGSSPALLEKHQGDRQALTSPSDGRIAINSTICLLNICTAEGFGI